MPVKARVACGLAIQSHQVCDCSGDVLAPSHRVCYSVGSSDAGVPALRFHSRRGYPDTLTFTEVDDFPSTINCVKTQECTWLAAALPLTHAHTDALPQPLPYADPKPAVCVITAQRALYRDPVTKLPYANAAAFHEIRRRLEAARRNSAATAAKLLPPASSSAAL